MYLYIPKDLATQKVNRPIEPEMVFADLCYRGVHYCKWVMVNSIAVNYQKNTGKSPTESWKLDW